VKFVFLWLEDIRPSIFEGFLPVQMDFWKQRFHLQCSELFPFDFASPLYKLVPVSWYVVKKAKMIVESACCPQQQPAAPQGANHKCIVPVLLYAFR